MLACLASLLLFAAPAPKLVIISWDGAPDWVMDRLVDEGKLPNVAKLKANGFAAEYSTPSFPSKTAVSHMAIFTGANPVANGVTGNTVPLLPRSEHTVLETKRGFDGSVHTAEPLWVTAAIAGRKVLCLSAAGSFPVEPDQARLRAKGVPLDRWVEFSGFESSITPTTVFSAGETPVEFAPGEKIQFLPQSWGRPEVFTSVKMVRNNQPIGELKPLKTGDIKGWSDAVEFRKDGLLANAYFRLIDLDQQTGKATILARATSGIKGTQPTKEVDEYVRAYGGFHDEGFRAYERGQLGKTLADGGDGSAEAMIVEMAKLDAEFLKRSFRYGWKTYRPDVVFHYTPTSDSAGHTWMGVLDPESPSYKPDLAAKIMPYYEQIFKIQDEWLGDMMQAAGPSTVFALVSDHGMAGISKYFNPNRALADAGLLNFAAGKIDLATTKALCPAWSDFAVVINGTEWKSGIVPPADREDVLNKAAEALFAVRDPETGRRIVNGVWRPERFVGMGIGGPAGGDLYFDLEPGYYPQPSSGALVSSGAPIIGNGVHGFWPQRRSMQAIFYAAGPGIAKVGSIPGVRVEDIGPTLFAAVGLPRPANATGHAIRDAVIK